MRRLLLVLGVAGMLLSAGLPAADGAEKCWSIGSPDDDYREFAIAGNHSAYADSFAQDVSYTVGESTPGEDWPYIHPGPRDAWAGGREHPFRITFNLDERPEGDCRLVVDLVNMQPNPPVLAVNINGLSTQVGLPKGIDNAAPAPQDDVKSHRAEVRFAADLLQAGKNTITLTGRQGSWMIYDALWLETGLPAPEDTTIRGFELKPTVLFVEHDGELRRVLEAVISNRGRAVRGSVSMEVAGRTVTTSLDEIGFGQHRYHLAIPTLDGKRTVSGTLKVGGAALEAKASVAPARRWRLFVAPSAHTDIGYTHVQDEVVKIHNRNTDTAIESRREIPGFKWNLEVSWQAQQYLENKPAEARQGLLSLGRKGGLGIQGFYLNMLTGLCSHEELNRVCYFAERLRKHYGVPMDSAALTDVPSSVWTVPTVLARSGVRYFSEGMNQTRGPFLSHADAQTSWSPFWWEGPDGSKVLTWFTESYAHAYRVGLRQDYDAVYRMLPQYLERFRNENYPYDAVFVYGGAFDNRPLDPAYGRIAAEWNEKWAYPKIILSTNAEFFSYIEENFGDQIPTFRGGGGTYWEDGAASSAKHTALNRRTHEKIVTAEKLNSIAAWMGLSDSYPLRRFRRAWENMLLYDEHTWGAHSSISEPESDFVRKQWEIKSSFAEKAAGQSSELLDGAWKELAGAVETGKRPAVVVFNPLSWPRTDAAEAALPADVAGGPLAVVDARTGRTVPCQRVGSDRVQFLARDVPPVGYRGYHLVAGRESDRDDPAVEFGPDGRTMENRFFRVTFDPDTGALESIYDRQLGRELLDRDSKFGGNEYVYVSGGEGSTILYNWGDRPDPELELHGPSGAEFRRGHSGPVSGSIVAKASAHMTPEVESTVTLYRDVKRIDFVNRVRKEETYDKEAVYFAFPFAAEDPSVRLEIPDGTTRPGEDQLDGGCREWYCLQHWAGVSGKQHRVAWSSPDAPLVCVGDINRGRWPAELPAENGSLFSYVMNNYWFTNYKASQGGEFTFRYSITAGPKREGELPALHFGWNHANPLLTRLLPARREGGLPLEGGSFCRVEPEGVILLTMKRAEDEHGWVLRLLEVAGTQTTARVTLPRLDVNKAWLCNLVEKTGALLEVDGHTVRVPVEARGISTVRIR